LVRISKVEIGRIINARQSDDAVLSADWRLCLCQLMTGQLSEIPYWVLDLDGSDGPYCKSVPVGQSAAVLPALPVLPYFAHTDILERA